MALVPLLVLATFAASSRIVWCANSQAPGTSNLSPSSAFMRAHTAPACSELPPSCNSTDDGVMGHGTCNQALHARAQDMNGLAHRKPDFVVSETDASLR